MKIEWEGGYFDGHTAQRRAAAVRAAADGLHITLDDGTVFLWPYSEVRQAQGAYRGQEVRLERGRTGEALAISDADVLTALNEAASRAGRHFQPRLGASAWLVGTLVAGTGAIVITAVLYLWGIPALADHVAARLPARWEAQLGQSVIEDLHRQTKWCGDPQLDTALDEITETLINPNIKTWTPSPYTFHVTVADDPMINALAAPGGYIVVFRGLLEKTRAPEELAGVLAHEIQHVFHRDATKGLIREMSLRTLLNVATGGAGTTPLAATSALARLRYSREAEAAADRDGMRMMLAARLDPQGMIRIFQTLKREAGQTPRALEYLSTHPDIDSRIAELQRLAREATDTPVPLLPGVGWDVIAHSCGLI